MRLLYIICFLISSHQLQAQFQVSGSLKDKSGMPVSGANIYLKNTYSGTSSLEDGSFLFMTDETGEQILVISSLGFEIKEVKMEVSNMSQLEIILREDVGTLDAVMITAGSFSAGDNSKVSVLKPLDVVTTAGVAGDFIAALQTLPGTQTVGEDGRLFVRGGTANETQIFIDGQRVFQPYTASANNIPVRGRYSPFLFDGITFSTGGYSAEYGQALSSVLSLNTIDEPDQNETDISLMSVGLGLGHTKKWDQTSVSFNASYINLAPYQVIIPNNQDFEFKKPYESFAGETVFRKRTKNGLLKFYAALDKTGFELFQSNFDGSRFVVDIANTNFYTNLSYFENLGNGWKLYPGASFSTNKNDIVLDAVNVVNKENAAHFKIKTQKKFNNRFKLSFGSEYFYQDFTERYQPSETEVFRNGFQNNVFSAFSEADLIFTRNFAVKPGIRYERMFMNNEERISPRLAAAYKSGTYSQFSLAYGEYFQQALKDYIRFDEHLEPESSSHYLINYQYTKPGYTLRAEAYYKKYRDLVRFDTYEPDFNSDFSNNGFGYAQGIDFFYRDNKTFKNIEYWMSYSFIDSKRNYRNFPEQATPSFVAAHSASLVTKYWVEDWQSQIGFSYNFSSGRPYENPNTPGFLNQKTKHYNNLSFNIAHLISQQKILYFSVSNILGTDNIFGYEYSRNPGVDGNFAGKPIRQMADRFFFVGFFWTISEDKAKNQLDNL